MVYTWRDEGSVESGQEAPWNSCHRLGLPGSEDGQSCVSNTVVGPLGHRGWGEAREEVKVTGAFCG